MTKQASKQFVLEEIGDNPDCLKNVKYVRLESIEGDKGFHPKLVTTNVFEKASRTKVKFLGIF